MSPVAARSPWVEKIRGASCAIDSNGDKTPWTERVLSASCVGDALDEELIDKPISPVR